MSRKVFCILLVIIFVSCKKDNTPPMLTTTISKIETTTNSVLIEGHYDYVMDIDNITIMYSDDEDMDIQDSEGMTVKGNEFNVFINGLKNNTVYYYKLKYLGVNNYYESNLYSFETNDIVKPVVATLDVTSITNNSAVCVGEIVSDGGGNIEDKGVCWSVYPNPDIDDDCNHEGIGCDDFTSTIYGLLPNTTYYVRAYATNEKGTAYGQEMSFVTYENIVLSPIIITHEISDITTTSVISGGDVLYDGGSQIIAKGLCWSDTNPEPTVSDNYKMEGDGNDNFVCTIEGLQPNTTYYVRAYATNSMETGYGESKVVRTFSQEIEFITISIDANTSFKMMRVAGGQFLMGAQQTNPSGDNYNEDADDCESPVHSVILDDFYIGETEVTQKLWTCIMHDNPGTDSDIGNVKPVINISWDDCQEFIRKLNEKTGMEFRLPTEAEWEFAAGGGVNSHGYIYSGGDEISDFAWYRDNSDFAFRNVGTRKPNELGIHDMSGNVYEWCQDWYDSDYYLDCPIYNPIGPSSGTYKVLRGGSFMMTEEQCRVTHRFFDVPNSEIYNNNIGMRLVLVQ